MPETMKLFESAKSKITNDENGENVPHSDINEVALVHCNVVESNFKEISRVLYTFVPNKSFAQLLDIFPATFIFLKTFNSEVSYVEVWYADQNFKTLEIEDIINFALVIN